MKRGSALTNVLFYGDLRRLKSIGSEQVFVFHTLCHKRKKDGHGVRRRKDAVNDRGVAY